MNKKQNIVIRLDRKFPKYVPTILNTASRISRAMAKERVGNLKEMLKTVQPASLEEWTTWYIHNHPTEIDQATERILHMLENFRHSLERIDRRMVREWVSELILSKTYSGIYIKRLITERLAENSDVQFSLPSQEEESQGIDGIIDGIPIAIKPRTFKNSVAHSDVTKAHIIYYEGPKNGAVELDLNGLPT